MKDVTKCRIGSSAFALLLPLVFMPVGWWIAALIPYKPPEWLRWPGTIACLIALGWLLNYLRVRAYDRCMARVYDREPI